MPMMTKTKTRAVVAACLVLVGAVFAVRRARARAADEAGLSEPLKRGVIQESVYGIGTVTANRSYQMKTGVTSTVLRLFVKEGDEVKKGAPLVELDGIGALNAPFEGTVTSLPFKAGETVFSQSVVLTLTNLSDRYVVVSLEQQAALRVVRGMPVRLSIDSLREQVFSGAVEAVYSNGTDFLARIGAADLPARVLPGMTADVAIAIQEKPGVLLLPVAAIDGDAVWVKRGNGSLFKVSVKTGVVDGAMAELRDGELREGDRLVLAGKGGG